MLADDCILSRWFQLPHAKAVSLATIEGTGTGTGAFAGEG